jgi:hypothetical protein
MNSSNTPNDDTSESKMSMKYCADLNAATVGGLSFCLQSCLQIDQTNLTDKEQDCFKNCNKSYSLLWNSYETNFLK